LLPVLRFWGQYLLLIGFFMVPKVKGRENLKEAERLRSVLIFNHVSYLDGLLVGSLFSPSGLAKVLLLVTSTFTSPPPPPFLIAGRKVPVGISADGNMQVSEQQSDI
jgi:1-acyl-sn-glycerol-3-phosphate acyltransferase